jgi:hypothetical protein
VDAAPEDGLACGPTCRLATSEICLYDGTLLKLQWTQDMRETCLGNRRRDGSRVHYSLYRVTRRSHIFLIERRVDEKHEAGLPEFAGNP